MEIELTIRDEDIDENMTRQADSLRREIFKRFPNAIWQRCGEGHKIVI